MDETLRRPAYDSNNLDPLDQEDRKLDDTSDGIDWDEITATTEPDCEAGRFTFNSADYPTDEAAMAAFEKYIHSIFETVLREIAPRASVDAPGP
jgi:hypothetical protein